MNKREKILAAGAGLVMVVLVTYLAVNQVFLVPAAEAEKLAQELTDKLARAKAEKGKETAYRNRLRDLAAQAFGTDEMRVSEQVRTTITEVLILSGLSNQNLSLKPIIGSRVPGVYREIGWSVRARGKLAQVIAFLFLLTKETHLHRLDNIVVAPVPNTQDVELQVKYATLLLEAQKGEKLVTDEIPQGIDPSLLDSPERQQYQVIAMRDLLRPYMPGKPQPPPEPPREPPRPREPSPPPKGSDARFRLVGLPTWGGRTDVLVRDGGNNRVTSFKTGDELAGGKIVMADYRPLPMPKKPQLLSPSRVVLQIGNDYYAVELGQSLAEKRTLTPEELPPGLPRIESPAPSEAPVPPGPAQK